MLDIDLERAAKFFESLASATAAHPGVTRDSYGTGEQKAHDLLAAEAQTLGLEVTNDNAGNLYMTLPGRDRDLPRVVLGSHLDSVPHGGNFDGAAGVIAGIIVLEAFRRWGVAPRRDICVMAIRAEESTWFPLSYIGSRAALGNLAPEELKSLRTDNARSLAWHMAKAGYDPDSVARGEAFLHPGQVACFLELHIEQGPQLLARDLPLGLVTGIRGSLRYRNACCIGEYAHSGAVPRNSRKDAVFGAASLVMGLDSLWQELESDGHDLTITLGQLQTDSKEHAFSKIPGLVRFCVDFRSLSEETLNLLDQRLHALCDSISQSRSVRFELGPRSGSTPALMDEEILNKLGSSAQKLGIPVYNMASGAGHDASVFANAGVPSGMVFVRNAHGSHNPDEGMDIEDFGLGCRLLAALLSQDNFPD
ncbi:Zn-dependent hydrolase [Limibacillus sp. MBR-115]|jgi:N-carbamoyl-L-amino-acid hydrolase|uniref:Zn-dependent hydrolase n=1 Tax=Limibacillus sp. MBR-115 TaxID=3156465 RepID=UPI003399E8B4